MPRDRTQEFVRVVSDPESGRTRRTRVMSELHKAGTPDDLEERRQWALATMRCAREGLVRELSNVTPALSFRNDTWSIIHTLWHIGARGTGHMDPAIDIVEHGATEVRSVPKREERFQQAIRMTLDEIDSAIAFTERCTVEQLAMHAKRVNRDVYVIGILEGTAEHFDDHLQQIMAMKRELGLEVFGTMREAEPAAPAEA